MPDETESKEFKSKLTTGRTRFLAHVVQHSLTSGRRSGADFIRRFPPSLIMAALETKPELRARILVETTGTREKVALQKTAASAGEDLQIALDVGETDPDAIVRLLRPDDRIRYLDAKALWAFVSEGEFWKAQLEGMSLEISRSHIGYVINNAMEEKLLKARDVIDGIGVDRLAEVLPRTELGWLLAKALDRGRERKPFTDEQFLAEAPVGILSDHVPLAELWERVVTTQVAIAQSFVEAPIRHSETPEANDPDETRSSSLPPASRTLSPPALGATPVTGDDGGDDAAESTDLEAFEAAKGAKAATPSIMKTATKVPLKSAKKRAAPKPAAAGEPPDGGVFDFSDVTASEEIEETVVK